MLESWAQSKPLQQIRILQTLLSGDVFTASIQRFIQRSPGGLNMLKQQKLMHKLEKIAEETVVEKVETANSAMKKAVTQAAKSRASRNNSKFPKNNHFCYR
jgi:hypothetical protein